MRWLAWTREDTLTLAIRWASVRNPGAEADVVAGSLAYADSAGRQPRSSGAKVVLDGAEKGVEARNRADLDMSAHQGTVAGVSSSSAPSGWSLCNQALHNGRQIAVSPVATSEASLLGLLAA